MVAIGDNIHIRADLIRELHLRKNPSPEENEGREWYVQTIYEGMYNNQCHNSYHATYEDALDDLEATIALLE